MKNFTNAVHKAANDAATRMTSELRKSARENNWHPDVIRNMKVNYSNGEFKVDIHPDYKDRAFVHEFGDENTRPSAVIRKYEGQTAEAEKFLTANISHHLGGKL